MKKVKLCKIELCPASAEYGETLMFSLRPASSDIVAACNALASEAAHEPDPEPDPWDDDQETSADRVLWFNALGELAERMQPIDADDGQQQIRVAGTVIGTIRYSTVDAWVPPSTQLAEITQAVARGWCHEQNSAKVMDPDLAYAIAEEVQKAI